MTLVLRLNRGITTVVLSIFVAAGLSAPAHAASYKAVDILNLLNVSAESSSSTYSRAKFKHWVDADKNGCDTREEVLIQESKVKAKTGKGCSLLSGKWVSAYENKTFTKASLLDIDHFIPLKEAWESGASAWSSADRQYFANDLEFAGSLIAVSASTNRSKGDRDPAQWMPSNNAYKCTYSVTWVQVKYRWSLTIDSSEAKALKKQLATCPKTKKYVMPKVARSMESTIPLPDESSSTSPVPVDDLDPQFATCSAAKAAGYGPYKMGVDPEYAWYRDGDGDGIVCE